VTRVRRGKVSTAADRRERRSKEWPTAREEEQRKTEDE